MEINFLPAKLILCSSFLFIFLPFQILWNPCSSASLFSVPQERQWQLYLDFQDFCVSEHSIPSVDILHSFTSNSVLRAEFCLLLSLTYSHSTALECVACRSPIVILTLSILHWGVPSPHNTPCTAWLLPGSAVCTSLFSMDFPRYRNLKVLDEDWINNTLKTITSYVHLMYPFSNCSAIHVCACLLILFSNIIKYIFSEIPWRGYEFVSVICD